MASVTKKSGKWYAIFQDASGKQKWVKGYSDKAETERLANKLQDEARAIRLGDVDPQVEAKRIQRAKPVEIQLADYKAKLQANGRTVGHVAYTIADVQKLIDFGEIKSAGEIDGLLMDRWVNALKAVDSNKTVNRRISSVQQLLKVLSENGGVTDYVLKRYPKLPTGAAFQRRKSRALVNGEVAKIIGVKVKKIDRRQLYQFALGTGLRLNECRQITPKLIDFAAKLIHIPEHIAKAKRDQTVPIHNSLVAMLKKRCKVTPANQPLFKIPTIKCVNRNIRHDCKLAGIDKTNVSFHSLRHTFCTLLARANVHPALLQRLARHSDLKTTLGYYVHLNRDDEAVAINRLALA